LIDIKGILNEALNSEHGESYRLVERNKNYRIGVGVELAPSGQPLFFIEIVVHLCADVPKPELDFLEKTLLFLEDLKTRGYSMLCQDDSSIVCQKTARPDDINVECQAIKSIASRTY
jgi:hypothetical protein